MHLYPFQSKENWSSYWLGYHSIGTVADRLPSQENGQCSKTSLKMTYMYTFCFSFSSFLHIFKESVKWHLKVNAIHQSQAAQPNPGQEEDSEGGLASGCLTQMERKHSYCKGCFRRYWQVTFLCMYGDLFGSQRNAATLTLYKTFNWLTSSAKRQSNYSAYTIVNN